MASFLQRKFVIPSISLDGGVFHDGDAKLVVISIFGKSTLRSEGCKATLADEFLGRRVFASSNPPAIDKTTLSLIEGFYDKSSNIVFLHLRSPLDAHHYAEALKTEADSKRGFQRFWADFRYQHARALLFLFSISHIMILSSPSPKFDLMYVQLFKTLEEIRQKLGSAGLGELLKDIPRISKEWTNQLRPCAPRLLFYSETCPVEIINAEPTFELNNRGNQHWPIKRMEHSLEDLIYRCLRKSRVITNLSTNSLFTIPVNQEFVFIDVKTPADFDRPAKSVNALILLCQGKPGSQQKHTPGAEPSFETEQDPSRLAHNFKTFLQQHIDRARSKGFDDNVGRHTPSAHFERPTAAVWIEASEKVYKFFMEEPSDSKHKQVMLQLQNAFNSALRFSEARCKKVMPLASAAYQDSLPANYTRVYHEGKLAHAVSVFVVNARGPLCEEYVEQLKDECERHWKAGRQMCEVPSLTGNPCTNPLHRSIEEEELCREAAARERLPIMPHSSGVRYISACDCGHKQGPRDDPFVLRTANCDFYAALGADCCENLERREFSVFQPSVKDFRAARLCPTKAELSGSRRESLRGENTGNTVTTQGNTQLGLSLGGFFSGHSGGSEVGNEDVNRLCSGFPPSRDENTDTDVASQQEIIIRVTDTDRESSRESFSSEESLIDDYEKGLVRQPSTTEYLPSMPHTESPPGLLPQFPSWSLVCLGSSSLYSHIHGLSDQPGFLPGTAFLLPWDVTVRLEPSTPEHPRGCNDPTRWPILTADSKPVSPAQSRKQANSKGRKLKTGQDQSEFVVKIFIGMEYECPRGHRFMCSTPDRVLKTSGTGQVKETGSKVALNDMPLYFPCPCRSAKPLVAQLMRVHVVTPKARVHVTLDPKVQPHPEPCPTFVSGFQEPIKLSQSTYWILRLPYIYVGEQGPFAPPKEPVPLSYGRLLAGIYGISNF